jgi:predicted nucleotidyltransferase
MRIKHARQQCAARNLAPASPNAGYDLVMSLHPDAEYIAARAERRALQDAIAADWRAARLHEVERLASTWEAAFPHTELWLFGSLALGTAAPGSDVDLLIRGANIADLPRADAFVRRAIHDAEIDLVPEELGRTAVVAQALAEGRRLAGSRERES